MRLKSLLIGIAAVTCVGGVASAQPDVIVGEMPNFANWGGVTVGPDVIAAYSIATTSCNLGNQNLQWIQSNNQHPVIPQNVYRVKKVNGATRIEQIGQSWLKHGFCALQGSVCLSGTPSAPNCSPTCGGCCTSLGIGCSDPYSNTRNGDQTLLGPRQEVNPWTGAFPYPYTLAFGGTGNTIYKRIQIKTSDYDPALQNVADFPALYVGEACYVHPTEGTNANKNNNYSYKRVIVGGTPVGTPPVRTLAFTGGIQRTKPAIYAWAELGAYNTGSGTYGPDANVTLRTVDDPAGGRFVVGYAVTEFIPGNWHYEYAIMNQNSDRGGKSWSVPVDANVALANVGFTDIASHSGESKVGTDWTFTHAGGFATWTTTSFASNPNSNAITWGTMYNFRFDADQAPIAAVGTLRTFKVEADLAVSISAPAVPPPPSCPGDANGDLVVDGADLSVMLGQFGSSVPPGTGADFNGDGNVDGADLSVLLSAFGSRC